MKDDNDDVTFAEPFEVNGVKQIPVWIKLTDNSLSELESIQGVKVTAIFDRLVTANVAIDALDQVAALKNVVKISVATMLKKLTQLLHSELFSKKFFP